MINSVIDTLSTYMMSLFPIPTGVIKRLDRIRRNFLCHGDREERLPFGLVELGHLWKKKGVLGIKNLEIQSKALMMKWL